MTPQGTYAMSVTTQPHPLVLDPKHPGVNDVEYTRRRRQLYDTALDYRVNEKGFPEVEYTEQEHAIWRHVATRLVALHRKSACSLYLKGKELLNIQTDFMPQLKQLNESLRQHHHFGMVPAEGLLDVETFFSYLSDGRMPVTQFIRHQGYPDFTPEPDAVHDVLGHVPCLMDGTYTEIVRLMGEGVRTAPSHDALLQWQRLYWFTIEFGMIMESNELKVIGAGLLSSIEEMQYCYGDKVDRRPFILDNVIATDYDPTIMQPVIFVIPSLAELKQETQRFLTRFK